MDEFNLVEQSQPAYLSEVTQKEVRIQEIVEAVDSDDDDGGYGDVGCGWNEAPDKNEIRTKLKLIKEKVETVGQI